ncbi:MAG: hypothetical protein NVSMB1_04810 [Polyangiales bacterium]
MSVDRDPPRLLERNGGLDESSRRLLDSVADDEPTEAQLRHLSARLARSVATRTLVVTESVSKRAVVPVAGGGHLALRANLLTGLFLLAIGAGGYKLWSVHLGTSPPQRTTDRDSRAAHDAQTESSAFPTRARTPPAPDESMTAQDSPPSKPQGNANDARVPAPPSVPSGSPFTPIAAASGASAHRAARTIPTAAESEKSNALNANDTDDELQLLERAHRALRKGDPLVALGLTQTLARLFSASPLSQEREVIAIESLLRLGRRAQAEARAKRFRDLYPNAPLQQRIDSLLSASTDGGAG